MYVTSSWANILPICVPRAFCAVSMDSNELYLEKHLVLET